MKVSSFLKKEELNFYFIACHSEWYLSWFKLSFLYIVHFCTFPHSRRIHWHLYNTIIYPYKQRKQISTMNDETPMCMAFMFLSFLNEVQEEMQFVQIFKRKGRDIVPFYIISKIISFIASTTTFFYYNAGYFQQFSFSSMCLRTFFFYFMIA